MFKAIGKIFGVLLLFIYRLVGNYGVAIFLFAVVVKIILLPFQMKSKKGMMRVSRLAPQMQELQKRHEGNPQKYQQEVSKLYKEAGANPMSGCLWTLLPFPILIALYEAIRYPLTVMMALPAELLSEGGAIYQKLVETGFSSNLSSAYVELAQSQWISQHWDSFAGLSDKLVNINYKFLGLDLGDMPQWNFFMKCDWSQVSSWLPAMGLFLIPIISALMSWVSMKITQKNSGQNNTPQTAQAGAQMKMMNLMMPIMSLYICFIMPAALGIYWIANSVLAIIQELILNNYYTKKLDAEDAVRLEQQKLREAELERKRQETEKLKAEGATTRNGNTSKKKLQAQQKAEYDQIKAAALREERAKRREMLGIKEEEIPASQSGNRRYARGRAYVPDRFTNPEHAAEATAAAAAESEFGQSIDENAEDDVITAQELSQTEAEENETENAVTQDELPEDDSEDSGEPCEDGDPGEEDQ